MIPGGVAVHPPAGVARGTWRIRSERAMTLESHGQYAEFAAADEPPVVVGALAGAAGPGGRDGSGVGRGDGGEPDPRPGQLAARREAGAARPRGGGVDGPDGGEPDPRPRQGTARRQLGSGMHAGGGLAGRGGSRCPGWGSRGATARPVVMARDGGRDLTCGTRAGCTTGAAAASLRVTMHAPHAGTAVAVPA